jgi:hypothetical protein
MFNVNVPVDVLREVEIVSVELPEPLTEAGLKLALVRLGSPVTAKLTGPLNPLLGVMVTV